MMLQSFGAIYIDDVAKGDDAISYILRKPYDIILCDYNLGYNRKNGQQVFEEVKHRKLIRFSTVFVMITAENILNRVIGAVEYQPDDYLIKPFSKDVLQSRLEKLIKKKSDFELTEKAIENREYIRAITLCDECINSNPKNPFEYLRLKADLCASIADYTEAIAVYEKVLSIRDIPWAKLGLGKMAFYTEDYNRAKMIFQSLLEENNMYIEAYDWLSKTFIELKLYKDAQHVLMNAAEISPYSIFRQKSIAKLSYNNNDYDTSEKTYKEAIQLGKYSYFKSPSDYSGLALVLVDKKKPEHALDVIKDIRNEFNNSPDVSFQASALEGIILKKMDRDEEARKAIDEASKHMEGISDGISEDIVLKIANTCYELDDKEKGKMFMENIIKNHHDDEKIIDQIQDIFNKLGLEDEGKRLIKDTTKEIIQINNTGVKLVEEGKFAEAIKYFERAANSLKGNKIINANAAHALILFMQKNGKDNKLLQRAKYYLERVVKIDPLYKKHKNLLNSYERLIAL